MGTETPRGGERGRLDLTLYCQETETCMVRACHTPRQPPQNHPSYQGFLEAERRCGRQRKCWIDNIKKRTFLPMSELLTRVSCRKNWKTIFAESSLMSPRRPNRSWDWAELNWTNTVANRMIPHYDGQSVSCFGVSLNVGSKSRDSVNKPQCSKEKKCPKLNGSEVHQHIPAYRLSAGPAGPLLPTLWGRLWQQKQDSLNSTKAVLTDREVDNQQTAKGTNSVR